MSLIFFRILALLAMALLEIDPGRGGLARENFSKTGLEGVIELRLADALKEIPKLQGPFDLVFLGAWKPDYLKYLEMVLPLVRPGGVIVAHNTRSHAEELAAFIKAVREHPQLKTELLELGSGGFSVSWKKN